MGKSLRPAQEQSFRDLMLTAELGGSLLTAVDLAAQVELELPLESTRGFSRHNLLRSGSVPAGVDAREWYGQKGSLHLLCFNQCHFKCCEAGMFLLCPTQYIRYFRLRAEQ